MVYVLTIRLISMFIVCCIVKVQFIALGSHAIRTVGQALDGDIEEYIPGAGAGFRDGDVQEAQFNEPRGIAIDKEGNLYIADVNNHRIRKVDTKLNIVTTIAGSGKGYKDGDPLEAQFDQPWGVYLDKNEFLYIADQNNHCIRKLAIE